jgi:hypothetical protein
MRKNVYNAEHPALIFTTAMFANATFAAIAGKHRLPIDSSKKLLAAFLMKKRITKWQ